MRQKTWILLTLTLIIALALAACGGNPATSTPTEQPAQEEAPTAQATARATEAPTEEAAGEATTLTMWYHGAGNMVEREILLNIVTDYNASQDKYVVEVQDFPQISYNESIVAAALAGELPDIIDVDGPVMPNWAWAGYMAPLELSEGALDDWLPGAIGEWDGQVYSVGLWDAAKAIFTRKSVLDEYGIRIPTLEEPWTLEEFDAALVTLQESGEFEHALDLGMAWTG
jgi:multiple sugar transport system substrate-binding protein